LKLIAKTGDERIALVYLAEGRDGRMVEFVESVQPPLTRVKKWVLIISTLYGCPSGCLFCDAGAAYKGALTRDEMLFQIDYMVKSRYPDRVIDTEKLKIQFARMGEPSFNDHVLDLLRELPLLYKTPNLIISLSSIAPEGREGFFERLIEIKRELYDNSFQLQFSLHTTDLRLRDRLMPIRKWGFDEIAAYGMEFSRTGKKVTLNFALGEGYPLDAEVLRRSFSPEHFLIKITPINPTYRAEKHNLKSFIKPHIEDYPLIDNLRKAGYDVILSIGELEENLIGSNCGQYVTKYLNMKKEEDTSLNAYSYPFTEVV